MSKLDRRKAMALFALGALGTISGAGAGARAQDKGAPEKATSAGTAPVKARPLLKPEYFTRDANMSPPLVSPDGVCLAWIENNELNIYNWEADTVETLKGGENDFASVEWINKDYLAIYLVTKEVPESRYIRTVGYSPLVVTKEAKFVRLLFAHDGDKISAADLRPIIRYIDAPEPYVIVIGSNNTNFIDVATGKRRIGPRLMDGEVHFFDRNGQERASVEILDGKVSFGMISLIFRYRATAGGKVETLHLPKQPDAYYTTFHYAEFDNALYWTEFNYTAGTATIYRYDLTTAAKSVHTTGTNKNMDLAFDTAGRVVGVTTVTDRVKTDWTDPHYLKITAAVQALFPSATVEITDVTEDGTQVVLMVAAPEAPDSYYHYSTESRELVLVGVNYPELDGQTLAHMTYVTYKARDGLDIPAYITKRKDTLPGAPLIVFPHGGPAARDVYGFDYQAQFFASRGYVVLQPQYRGSAGFSDAFERAGNKHMAQMTTDLEDGVRSLQAQGMINPAKVCVAGWSWGGYLAQAGLAFTPDTYVCGISGAGISDLFESLDDDNDFYWGGYGNEYWRAIIGSAMGDHDMIRATSPIFHVDAIKAPLLLIHGESDDNVNVRQSKRMNEEMGKAGKAVTYLPVKYMHHGPGTAEERLLVLKAMDSFIADAFARVDAKSAG